MQLQILCMIYYVCLLFYFEAAILFFRLIQLEQPLGKINCNSIAFRYCNDYSIVSYNFNCIHNRYVDRYKGQLYSPRNKNTYLSKI